MGVAVVVLVDSYGNFSTVQATPAAHSAPPVSNILLNDWGSEAELHGRFPAVHAVAPAIPPAPLGFDTSYGYSQLDNSALPTHDRDIETVFNSWVPTIGYSSISTHPSLDGVEAAVYVPETSSLAPRTATASSEMSSPETSQPTPSDMGNITFSRLHVCETCGSE